ncbi:aminotransferase class IV [Brevundimonas sp.]|uniref:aminotransferase class IV n=1 Tax=Brevundimonas sp. TaxID=1871086 RepID=UPI0035AFCDB2
MAAGDLRIDGAPATAGDLSQLALVNYGAYTSFRVEGGGVRGLDLHLARLEASAVELFGEPVGEERLRRLMRAAVSDRPDCWLRVSLFSLQIGPRTPEWRGVPKVMTAALPPPPPLAESLRLQVQRHSRHAPHLKHSGAFDLIRARRLARAAGFDDALFVDEAGRVSEGSLWNIGFLSGDLVVWPDAPMLAGVGQALIRRGLAAAGLNDTVARVDLPDLGRFDGAFICNSATPVCAVVAIGDHGFAVRGESIERLRAAWASNPPQPI